MKNHVSILSIPIWNKNMGEAVTMLSTWISNKEGRYVCAADVHSIMRAQEDKAHLDALQHHNLQDKLNCQHFL